MMVHTAGLSWVLQGQETSCLLIPDRAISNLASGVEKKEDPRNFNTLQPSDLIVCVFINFITIDMY